MKEGTCTPARRPSMCDYSLSAVKTRPAAVGDKLVVQDFGTGTRGFADRADADTCPTAVCVLPGTEIAFDKSVLHYEAIAYLGWSTTLKIAHKVARFRQIDKDEKRR